MKVLGKSKEGYICEVNHSEIEQFLNLYYGKMGSLSVGDEVNLGEGYKWDSKIYSALRQTQEFVTSNKPIIQSLMEGYSVLTNIVDQNKEGVK